MTTTEAVASSYTGQIVLIVWGVLFALALTRFVWLARQQRSQNWGKPARRSAAAAGLLDRGCAIVLATALLPAGTLYILARRLRGARLVEDRSWAHDGKLIRWAKFPGRSRWYGFDVFVDLLSAGVGRVPLSLVAEAQRPDVLTGDERIEDLLLLAGVADRYEPGRAADLYVAAHMKGERIAEEHQPVADAMRDVFVIFDAESPAEAVRLLQRISPRRARQATSYRRALREAVSRAHNRHWQKHCRPDSSRRHLTHSSPTKSTTQRRQRSREHQATVHRQGGRRVASRSAGGGSSGDDAGGDSEGPGERPRRIALIAAAFVAAVVVPIFGGAMPSEATPVIVTGYEGRGADFRYPSTRPFEPAPDSEFREIQPWVQSAAEALLDDPRRLADRDSDEHHAWVSEVIFHVLERSADAYKPGQSYMADNLGPLLGECLGDAELKSLLQALLDDDLSTAKKFIGRVTRFSERAALKSRHDSFDHFEVRRLGSGELRVMMDQRHASRLALKALAPRSALLVTRRVLSRCRAPRAAAPRMRGSRRVTSRSAGGGSSGDSSDPPGEPESERPSRRGLQGQRVGDEFREAVPS